MDKIHTTYINRRHEGCRPSHPRSQSCTSQELRFRSRIAAPRKEIKRRRRSAPDETQSTARRLSLSEFEMHLGPDIAEDVEGETEHQLSQSCFVSGFAETSVSTLNTQLGKHYNVESEKGHPLPRSCCESELPGASASLMDAKLRREGMRNLRTPSRKARRHGRSDWQDDLYGKGYLNNNTPNVPSAYGKENQNTLKIVTGHQHSSSGMNPPEHPPSYESLYPSPEHLSSVDLVGECHIKKYQSSHYTHRAHNAIITSSQRHNDVADVVLT